MYKLLFKLMLYWYILKRNSNKNKLYLEERFNIYFKTILQIFFRYKRYYISFQAKSLFYFINDILLFEVVISPFHNNINTSQSCICLINNPVCNDNSFIRRFSRNNTLPNERLIYWDSQRRYFSIL
jgi:hypothetical protein